MLVAVEDASRNCCPLESLSIPDKKGFIRKIKVRVRSTVLERPVDKLVLLVEDEE